jgi:hypothetical protein
VQDVRLKCVIAALSNFGENSKAAIVRQLDEQGVSLTPVGFNIEEFCTVLTEALGRMADFVFVKIIDDVCRQSNLSLEDLGITPIDDQAKLLTQLFLAMGALKNE